MTKAIMGERGYLDSSYLRRDPERAAEEFKEKAESNLTIFGGEQQQGHFEFLALQHVKDKYDTSEEKLEEIQVKAEQDLGTELSSYNTMGTPDKMKAWNVMDNVASEIAEPQQKVVDEDEVKEYLEKGYKFVDKLNDSKAIVEK